jgi:hypothetical protein
MIFSRRQTQNITAISKYITFSEQEEQKFRYYISLAQKFRVIALLLLSQIRTCI